jgi:hypothetical protein
MLSIWMAKFTVSEFLKRLTERFWKKGYEFGLRAIRIFLVFTFVGVVIATFAECDTGRYWQVVPDPGPQCTYLSPKETIVRAVCIQDIITNLFQVDKAMPSCLPWASPTSSPTFY